MADTRKDKRAPVSLKVRFKSATVDEFIEHYSKDVSRGGIYIKSSQPMPVGTLLKFQFQLKDDSALIRGVGRVVWTRAEEDAAADMPAGMGIKFIKMDNESRATVERIVEAYAPGQGMFESGREHATTIETSSAPPPPEAGPFFPDFPAAAMPAPEDRTAVRQATELLANVLSEAGTDEAALAEAQQRAEEARRRTEEIERARRQAELRKRQEVELPSMIVDPSLDARPGRPSEREHPSQVIPLPQAPRTVPEDEHDPDTEPPPSEQESEAAVATPTPSREAPSGKPTAARRYLPWAAIAALLVVAGVVAWRGGPREIPVEDTHAVARPAEQAPAEPPRIEPAPAEPAPEPAAAAEPPPAAVPAPDSKVEVLTTPPGATVYVGDEPRGKSPVTLELTQGVPVTVRAEAPGHAELREEVTPKAPAESHRLKLQPLPYVVHVESSPPGALVNVGGHRATAPAEVALDGVPSGPVSVSARLSGYEPARTRVVPTAFEQTDSAMLARLSLTLRATTAADERVRAKRASRAAAPAPVPAEGGSEAPPAQGSGDAASSTPAPTQEAEPAAAPSPAPDEPAKEPVPGEPLPTNPFANDP